MKQEYVFTKCIKDGGGYVVIHAENAVEARKRMFEVYGSKWAFQYDPPNARKKAGDNGIGLVAELEA